MKGTQTLQNFHITQFIKLFGAEIAEVCSNELKELYVEFMYCTSIKARIARDLVKLNSLQQLYFYRNKIESSEFDFFKGDLIKQIDPDLGVKLMNIIVKNSI
ncbi:hypothetical protein CJD36_022470 [Flavipsychrobacter stenotrophus]|uniref:Uncharacterized protein n=1 Tax=Flavipsychrobacter stenotrophus TaxID=2077091 RepID=A0A2S7SQ66_9BACT|nr:hypothetical protein CJD36_022470 [Flavipsychrobacter stenotrophus]